MPDILDDFSKDDVQEFQEDFLFLLKMSIQMNDDYNNANPKFYYNKPLFEKYNTQFSKKYNTMIVAPLFDDSEKFFRVFFKEKDLKSAFMSSMAKIEGLVSIGSSSMKEVSVKDVKEAQFALKRITNKLSVKYYSGSVLLEKENSELIELVYDLETIKDVEGPEFKLCAFYAIQGDYDRKINLHSVANAFVFTSLGTAKTHYGPSK